MSLYQELLARIDLLHGELDKLRPLNQELENRVQQKFRLWWTYHSNAIEGNKLTQGETEMFLMEGLTAKGKPLKDHLDLRGHSNAINYLLGFIRDKEVLTEAAIRKLHEILLVEPYQVQAIDPNGAPTMKTVALGQYKTQPNHVRTPTGEIHYYATPEETPAKMEELMAWYRAETEKKLMHPVEIAARFHHRFTTIHPFDDGNGRMARLLMNLMLMQSGYPPVVIRIDERDQYLATLRSADREDYDGFLAFIAEHAVASEELYLKAAKGEDIHEPTDIEKEIALLKIELKPIEEPEPLSPEILKRLFENSINPLFAEIARLMSPLCELFSSNRINFQGRNVSFTIDVFRLSTQPLSHFVPSNFLPIASAPNLDANFVLSGFKKALFNTFDLSCLLRIKLEPLKYSLYIMGNGGVHIFSIQHFYQEPLTRDEISAAAQKLTRVFVDDVKSKTTAQG